MRPCATAFVLALLAASAAADCRDIRFQRGSTAAEITGTAPAESSECLRFAAGKGQTVRLTLASKSGDVAFSVVGVADNRTELQFTSERKTYEVRIHQTSKSLAPEDYSLSLSIE